MDKNLKKIRYKIHGMHCASCEVVIERKLKNIPGIEKVNISYSTGIAQIACSKEPKLSELQNKIKGDGYAISLWNEGSKNISRNTVRDYVEIGMIFLLLAGLYMIANGLG